MTVTLTTKEGFGGKLYAYQNIRGCQSKGKGRTETSLRFFYEEDEADIPKAQQCGVKEEKKGIFSNTVVIQNHPIIQQKGDRAIKLYCYFDTGEKTVSNSYNVLEGTIPVGPTPAPGEVISIVNCKDELNIELVIRKIREGIYILFISPCNYKSYTRNVSLGFFKLNL